ncbi:MAG: putative lipid II flippase FtsW, partial [Planctomycetota bacterium]|nr:putative lipid II flippase FtsW [Planctomycetota bacterium]
MMTSRNMILVLALTLAVFGIVMIYSASFIAAENSNKFPDGYFFLRKQIVWLMISLLGLFLASQIDFRFWRRVAIPFLAVCMVLLCVVLVPGVGTQVGGARRWLRFGALGFQPSEMTKLAVVIFMGWFCARDPKRVRRFFSGFVLAMVVLGMTCGLVLLEPDIGTAFFIGLMGCSLFVIGGGRLAFILPSVALAVPCGYFALMTFFPHARDRITTFLNPDLDPLGKGHQIKQSLIALGSGGDFGVGLGMSRQKLLFLPEEHTDFIFSVIGEELGFAGAIAVILLFVLLFWYATKVALGTRDPFARVVAFGIGLWTACQAAFNIAVASAAIPTKGISLPFISFGGSHLFCSFVAIGVL